MKKIVFLIMCLCSVYANSQEGIPFFVNYPASVYQAHNRNFDVVCDSCGNVYFANFEGILHYDYNRWETIYTPGFSRVTRLFRDSEGRIWVGGYNVFGRIERDGRGCITLRTLLSDLDTDSLGELEDMAEIDKRIYLKATSGRYYTVQSDSILTGSGTSGPIAGKVEKSILSLNESGVFSTRRRNNLDKLCPWINNG